MNQTPAHSSHIKQGAKMISFANWSMPFSYSNPSQEHIHVRQSGGIFDTSHMGEIRISGAKSLSFLEHLVPSDIASLKKGHCQYSVLCNAEGGMLDDIIIYCLQYGQDYLICVNAGSKDKDLNWLKSHQADFQVDIKDESQHWAMTAVQGPKALEFCQSFFPDVDLLSLNKFQFAWDKNQTHLFSKTGYTGEEGLEIYSPWEQFPTLWEQVLTKAKDFSIKPVGLGARDTLRLEMAYLLSGQDFHEKYSPVAAGLSWLIKNPKNYLGKNSILKDQNNPKLVTLKAFTMKENVAVPRKGYPILSDEGQAIGVVTSGAKSPSLEKMIGLAYIQEESKNYFVDIRGSKASINIVKKPFLKK